MILKTTGPYISLVIIQKYKEEFHILIPGLVSQFSLGF